ncbi:hypothetical protein [Curtobacterium sp. L1-20]|uniref:hypothetical protein n=1 Tax=Curtobacterium sp. L1-20 TaxID=3138181 RepID=UPI003B529ED7
MIASDDPGGEDPSEDGYADLNKKFTAAVQQAVHATECCTQRCLCFVELASVVQGVGSHLGIARSTNAGLHEEDRVRADETDEGNKRCADAG